MMERNNALGGHIAMLCANVMWGMAVPLGKDALNCVDIAPLALTGVRVIGTALLFWLFTPLLPGAVAPRERIEGKDRVSVFLAALLITFANQMCIIFGVSMTSPVEATVMLSTTPFFTLILAWLFYRARHGWARVLGVATGFSGMLVYILSAKTDAGLHVTNPVLGDLLCVLSQVCGATYIVRFAFLTRKYSPFTLMKWMFTVSAALMIPAAGWSICQTDWAGLPGEVLWETGSIIVLGTFLPFLLLPFGQRALPATSIAMYDYLQPVVAAAFSIGIGVAVVTTSTIAGAALIFLGIALVNGTRKRQAA